MPSRAINTLYAPLQKVLRKALDIADSRNLGVIITCTKRSQLEQAALYCQGREALVITNAVRKMAKLPLLRAGSRPKKITWTLDTYHCTEPYAMAFDYCISEKASAIWDIKADVNKNKIPDYEEFATICKELDPNIEWGGDWKKKDYCHVQWKKGLKINQCAGRNQLVQPATFKELLQIIGNYTKRKDI